MAKISDLHESARQLQALMLNAQLERISTLESEVTRLTAELATAQARIAELEGESLEGWGESAPTPTFSRRAFTIYSQGLLWVARDESKPHYAVQTFAVLRSALRYANAQIKATPEGK